MPMVADVIRALADRVGVVAIAVPITTGQLCSLLVVEVLTVDLEKTLHCCMLHVLLRYCSVITITDLGCAV